MLMIVKLVITQVVIEIRNSLMIILIQVQVVEEVLLLMVPTSLNFILALLIQV